MEQSIDRAENPLTFTDAEGTTRPIVPQTTEGCERPTGAVTFDEECNKYKKAIMTHNTPNHKPKHGKRVFSTKIYSDKEVKIMNNLYNNNLSSRIFRTVYDFNDTPFTLKELTLKLKTDKTNSVSATLSILSKSLEKLGYMKIERNKNKGLKKLTYIFSHRGIDIENVWIAYLDQLSIDRKEKKATLASKTVKKALKKLEPTINQDINFPPKTSLDDAVKKSRISIPSKIDINVTVEVHFKFS